MEKESKKKKILFIITQSEFGGAQRFLMELVTHLDAGTYESLVASQPGELLNTLKAKGIPIEPLKCLRRDVSPLNDLLGLLEIRRLLKHERPDVLFLLSSKAGFLGSLAARLLLYTHTLVYECRVLYRIGGWAFNDPKLWFSRKLYLVAEKLSARWKDVIIVNSEHDRQQAEQLGICPREKLLTIYNGINPAELHFLPREEARKKLSDVIPAKAGIQTLDPRVKPEDDKAFNSCQLIGTIANFYKTKGLPVLIEAMAEVHKINPDSKLVVIGDGRERKNYELRIADCGLEKKVILAGWLAEAWKYMKAFDIFVLPSLKEGFPWVLLEAMAAGVPVVATRVGAVPEIIEDGKNGWIVHPGDVEALQRAISELLGNDSLQNSFAAHAKETVEQKFRLDVMIQNIQECL